MAINFSPRNTFTTSHKFWYIAFFSFILLKFPLCPGQTKERQTLRDPSRNHQEVIHNTQPQFMETNIYYSLCNKNLHQESRFLQAGEWGMVIEYVKMPQSSLKKNSAVFIFFLVKHSPECCVWLDARIQKEFILIFLLVCSLLLWRHGVLE